jgi:uncharacterized membrane protein
LSYYEVLLFLHIGGAIIWLGSAFLLQMLFYRATSTANFALVEGMSANTAWLAQRIFIPTSLAMLVLGILLTIEGPWEFDMLWIVLGLVAFAATFALGIGMIEPEGKKLGAASVAHGQGHPEVVWRSRRIDALGKLDLALLWVVVLDMTVKPTGDDVVTLVIMAAALLLAGGYVANVLRAPAPTATQASPAAASRAE